MIGSMVVSILPRVAAFVGGLVLTLITVEAGAQRDRVAQNCNGTIACTVHVSVGGNWTIVDSIHENGKCQCVSTPDGSTSCATIGCSVEDVVRPLLGQGVNSIMQGLTCYSGSSAPVSAAVSKHDCNSGVTGVSCFAYASSDCSGDGTYWYYDVTCPTANLCGGRTCQ